MRQRRVLMVAVLLIVAAAVAFGSLSFAKGKPPRPGDKCPDRLIFCLDVWDPVICDDGKVYSNDCYARRACATGCEPYGAF